MFFLDYKKFSEYNFFLFISSDYSVHFCYQDLQKIHNDRLERKFFDNIYQG